MNKRDLKADLEKFEKINEIIPEPTGDFIRDVVAPHALQRAIAAEEEVERLKEENTHLQEWRDRKYHVDDVSRSYWQRQTAKIKHLIPDEDKPGIGSIVKMLLLKESQLQDVLNTLQWYADIDHHLIDWDEGGSEVDGDAGKRAKAAIQRIQEGKQS